jgi:hypothetical protein
LLDAPTAGLLLAIRRGLIEETGAETASEMALIDLAVIAHANAMRIQTMIGNSALIIESELFAQQSMRAKWKSTHGGRYETIQGLAVEDHLRVLRDRLMPLVEKFHRLAREHIKAFYRLRQKPAVRVEQAKAINLVLVARWPVEEMTKKIGLDQFALGLNGARLVEAGLTLVEEALEFSNDDLEIFMEFPPRTAPE